MTVDMEYDEIMNAVEHLVRAGGDVSIKHTTHCIECNRAKCWCKDKGHQIPLVKVSTTLTFWPTSIGTKMGKKGRL